MPDDQRPRDRHDQPDPLSEAEELRSRLQEALARTDRLVAALKRHRRESRAVRSAMASLRKLSQLGG